MNESVKVPEKNSGSGKEERKSKTQKSGYLVSAHSSLDRILYLQRIIGNQEVGRLINSGDLKAKLKIGQPGDICEKEEKLRSQNITSVPEISHELESRINTLSGGGQPLPESSRSFFEPRFGHDFGQVRVHTDANAAELAHAVNARAFTKGQDVVFGAGQYSPETYAGQRLLAHELTHVVQQHQGLSARDVVRRLPDPDCNTFSARPFRGSLGPFVHTNYTPSFRGAGATININVSVDYDTPPPPVVAGKEDFRVTVRQCHLAIDEDVKSILSSGLPDTVRFSVTLPGVSWNTYDAFYIRIYSRSSLRIRADFSII